MTEAPYTQIAIIGMGCRFPGGVESPASLWQLCAKRSTSPHHHGSHHRER